MSDVKVSRNFPTFVRAGRWTRAATRRLIRRTWKSVVALFLLIAVVHATATFILGRRVEAEIAAIRARGEPLTVAEMTLPSVSDDQNAAVVYERIIPMLPEQDSDAWDSMEHALRRFFEDVEMTDAEWRAAAKALAPYYAVLDQVDEAVDRPRFRPNIPHAGSRESDIQYRLRYYSQLQVLTRILVLRAMVETQARREALALRAIERAVRVEASLDTGAAPLLGLWLGCSLPEASGTLRYAARRMHIKTADARRLYDAYSGIDLVPGYVAELHRNRASVLELSPRAIRYGPRAIDLLMRRKQAAPPLTRLEGYAWRPLAYYNLWLYLRFMRHAIDIGARPWRGIAAMGFPYDPMRQPWWTTWHDRCSLDAVRGRLQSRTVIETDVAGSRIFLALLAYRDREGRYPQSLAELRAGLGWELPPDPFSGRDFGYRLVGEGFRLYSVGTNLRDDGGECDFGPYATRAPKRSYRYPEEPADDIIWRMP